MLPKQTTKTFLTTSLAKGPTPEAAISNPEFMDSYLDYSCWLRTISARQQVKILEDKEAGEVERLAALASFYQIAGAVVEDALSMYVAWSLWSCDKSKSIPDILERVSLRLSEPKSPLPETYTEEIRTKFKLNEKRLDVYARQYLVQLMAVTDAELPKAFGIPWKPHPSVKLVPKDWLPYWTRLGEYMRESIRPLVNTKGALLASCYNKIKHGPQIIVMPLSVGVERRGFSYEYLASTNTQPTLRLLLNGARTQESDDEFENECRAAPFLPLDSTNVRRWFFQHIVHTSNALFLHGTWIYNSTYPLRKRAMKVESPELMSIILEHGVHLNRHFGTPI